MTAFPGPRGCASRCLRLLLREFPARFSADAAESPDEARGALGMLTEGLKVPP